MDLSFPLPGSPTVSPGRPTLIASRAPTPCDGCNARASCPGPVMAAHMERPLPQRRLRAGQALFRSGDPFTSCWSVRDGAMKSVLVLLDGREQVMGFHFAGEMLGADAIAGGKHPTSAVALEDCTVCALPAHVDGPEGPAIRSRFWSAIAMAALREREVASLLASSGAEQRVAGFLVDLAARLGGRAGPRGDFRLPMSRAEIASLLGLSVETVSRSFTALAQQGFIDVRRKRIRIADPGRLGAHAPPPALGWMRAATMHEEASA